MREENTVKGIRYAVKKAVETVSAMTDMPSMTYNETIKQLNEYRAQRLLAIEGDTSEKSVIKEMAEWTARSLRTISHKLKSYGKKCLTCVYVSGCNVWCLSWS